MAELRPLWAPSPDGATQSQLATFQALIEAQHGTRFQTYPDFHAWSVEHLADFWSTWLRESGICYEGSTDPVVETKPMPLARYFPNVRLNFAENLLRRVSDDPAVVSIRESEGRKEMSGRTLARHSQTLAAFLKARGIQAGDRIAALVPNSLEPIIGMLAASQLGAVWSSCSPDFGIQGVVDRFGQIKPKVLIAVEGYHYGGKYFDCTDKFLSIQLQIPTIETTVLIASSGAEGDPHLGDSVFDWDDACSSHPPLLEYQRFPFNHPLYVMYSSGTTGKPKSIVHGAGGTLLQHTKELMLHTDLRATDTITYFTTCGWMMWNWVVSSLFTGARVVVFDGSPSFPNLNRLWDLVRDESISVFGTSAKFISSCRAAALPLHKTHTMPALRAILSTGSPLAPEDFRWVYSDVKSDLLLSSISGGTDIISCFMLGNPTLPVYAGEIQCLGLGMDVAAFNADGQAVTGQKGELVCRQPAPSMPISFYDDPMYERYRAAYFARFENVWCHGDFIEITPRGGIRVYGRSDATLNPGGVRIGTAEIYRLVEGLPEVDDSLVIGQPWQGDVRVVLFVKLAAGSTLDLTLEDKIRRTIRSGATPRHVPKRILPIEAIPYTLNGKKVELAVLATLTGQAVTNREALANPESLEGFLKLREALST